MFEKNLDEELHMLQIDINEGDLYDVIDLIEDLPFVVVLDHGTKILEEKLTL